MKRNEKTSKRVASKAGRSLRQLRELRKQSAKAYSEVAKLHKMLNAAIEDAESAAASALTQASGEP